MTDQELRALVREAVQRHLGGRPTAAPPPFAHAPAAPVAVAGPAHASHALYITVINSGDACVIEPASPCDHCGYCKSHGH